MKKFIIAFATAAIAAAPVFAAPSHPHGQPYGHDRSYDQKGPQRGGDHRTEQKRQPSAQQGRHTPHHQVHKARPGAYQQQWKRGDRFDRKKSANYRVIEKPRAYQLQNAPRGYRWVQSGRDAVLVRLSNNIISSVKYNAFR